MNNASKGKEVKQNVSSTIQSAIRELIASEMEPNEETGFDYLEYDHLEIYKGKYKQLIIGLPIKNATNVFLKVVVLLEIFIDL